MTLFVPLAARARQTRLKRPALRDPKAVEMIESIDHDVSVYDRGWGGFVTVLRTLIFDWWVRQFLAAHPAGTVVELGAGLNSRFERTDNGTARYVELDLPDTIELRRRFFADTGRRRMVAGSVLDEDWMDVVAFDTYTKAMLERQHKAAARRGMAARWAWGCDDPRAFERAGLRLTESATITRLPRGLRPELPARYRYLLPLAAPLLGKVVTLSLFQAPVLAAPAGTDGRGAAR